MAERTKWTDERVDDLVTNVDRRFDGVDRRFDLVDRRFDRVEGDIQELRQLVYYLWGSMLIGFLVVIATVLLGHH
jgi:Flp pilus assembly protein TadB